MAPEFLKKGSPLPLGATIQEDGINFALVSQRAEKVVLGLFKDNSDTPFVEFPLHRTENTWHICIKNVSLPCTYAYRIEPSNTWLLDPYAKAMNTSAKWGEPKRAYLGKVFKSEPFDWGDEKRPAIPFKNLRLYEMHVRGMTQDSSSGVKYPGTYLGLIEKIPHLKELGINAVELLPTFEFDETDHFYENPTTKVKLRNFWGYMTVSYFTPMQRYATQSHLAITEFKQMVKAFHKEGIEVILDIVFNHSPEKTPERERIFGMRGIDRDIYYLFDENGNDCNFTGCGNTLNCNHPVMIQLILSVLRYWIEEMHVDGFRFDLASTFFRGEKGIYLENPPIIQAILEDPVIRKSKLIAEAWDAAGLYQVGRFNPQFFEWNGSYRDSVRRFIKGERGQAGNFATAMCGSENLFKEKMDSYFSINFITSHDGFTLRDLVSYNHKHNEQNGEHNRDGLDHNDSWNCGVEGPTQDPVINALRDRQMRNFVLALTLAVGTPMFYMGDEYALSKGGNNNSYSQEEMNYFHWNQKGALHPFFQKMVHFRKNSSVLQRKTFLTDKDVIWHSPDWSNESHLVTYTLLDKEQGKDLFIAFNAKDQGQEIHLPDGKWTLIVDTSFSPKPLGKTYILEPHSALLLSL